MHDFKFKNGELYCEDVKVKDVAAKVGTPFYLYSHHTLVDHFTKIQTAFAPVHPLICFAMKSNDNLAVLKTLKDLGAGFDIVSVGELKKALRTGVDAEKIVFASVGKTEEEISDAIRAGILLFNVESLPELEEINRLAGALNSRARVALRLNPDVTALTHAKITTGTLKNKFGIDLKTARKILRDANHYPHVNLSGLHIHIGSQITTKSPFLRALTTVIAFLEVLRKDGVRLEYLDIGGGLGIIYKDEKPQTARDFAGAVLPHLKKTGLKIIMEPGRFIAGNAGILIVKVLYLKDNGLKKFLIVDGGMNDLIRPALYDAYHEIVPVIATKTRKVKMDIVGPVCESGDFLGKDRLFPLLKKGDLVAVISAGAYGYVMASNYNQRGRPPEVMVKGREFEITKQRETFDDLMRGETIPSFLRG